MKTVGFLSFAATAAPIAVAVSANAMMSTGAVVPTCSCTCSASTKKLQAVRSATGTCFPCEGLASKYGLLVLFSRTAVRTKLFSLKLHAVLGTVSTITVIVPTLYVSYIHSSCHQEHF